MRRIKVIVPVSTDMWNEPVRKLMEHHKERDTEINIMNLNKGPVSLECAYDKVWAALPTVQEAERAEQEGYNGVIIYCFADPGLTAAKEKLQIPAVGLCEASIHLASLLGSRFSIMAAGSPNVFENKRKRIVERLREYGFEHKCASVRPLMVAVLDLVKEHEKKATRLLSEAEKAVEEDGADTIVLGCGGILGVGERASEALNVPVVVPGVAALKTCESLIQMGLSQSKRCFGIPEEKIRIP